MDSTTITPPGPPWTWENITPEQYEITPFTEGWPWCEPGQFPITYDWEAPCIDVDPCQDTVEFGGSLLWGGEPCDLTTHPYVIERGAAEPNQTDCTTGVYNDLGECQPRGGVCDPAICDDTAIVVDIADPPSVPTTETTVVQPVQTLPATGMSAPFLVLAAVALVCIGFVLARWAVRR